MRVRRRERIVNRGNLKAEKTTSCGCLQQELRLRRAYDNRSVDVGEVFGRLTVTKLLPAQKAAVVCECGAHKVLPRHALRQGHTRSCGCYLRDVLRERNHVPGSVPGYRSLAKSNGTFTYKDWEKLLVRWNFSCYYCGVVAPLEKDHIIPLSRGGRHSIGNILPACRLCNASKGAQLLVEWKYLRRRTATKRNLV